MNEAEEEESISEINENSNLPGIINRQLLVDLAIEQGTKTEEAGNLFIADGVNLAEIEEIRIEFLNILKIDNLWIMADRLTRLRLSNNAIGKIENLDSLVHLIELDLSFNRIKIIENLDNLVKLEVLLLSGNEICDVANFEKSTQLTILSIGANQIDTWDHVMYLRQFKKLRSLNVAGNSCTNEEGYYEYLVGFLSQIVYVNYKMVTESERQNAMEKNQRAIENLMEAEATEKAEMEEKQIEEERQAILSLSYVEYLDGDGLFRRMFDNDREGKEFAFLNEDAREAYREYEKRFTDLCRQIYELGLEQRKKRNEEIKLFEKIIDQGREAVHSEARTMMDEIIARKVDIFEQIRELLINTTKPDDSSIKQNVNLNEIEDGIEEHVEEAHRLSNEFNELLIKTWNRLMDREVILHEQIEDTNETHKINVGDLTTNFIESARALFGLLRDSEADYNDNIEGIATIYVNTFTDEIKMPSHHFELFGNKDKLSNNLLASHDLHLQIIDAREDVMLSKIKNWYENYTEQLARDETERNRNQVLEISHFLEHQREEFYALQLQFNSGSGEALDTDFIIGLDGR